jgi:hypothetical protein
MIGTPLADYPHDSLDWEVVDLDQPEEGYWAVWRCSRWGEVAEVGQYLSQQQAQAVADELTVARMAWPWAAKWPCTEWCGGNAR